MFIEDLYEDLEFWYPYYRLKEEGAYVTVIGPEIDDYKGKHGLPAQADMTIEKARPADFEALIIPGGYSPDRMRRHPLMIEFVKEIYEADKVVAAICHGPWMLASADIVEGKRITSFFSIKDDLINAGAEWVDQDVVIDSNLITSRSPDDLPAFCKKIINTLS